MRAVVCVLLAATLAETSPAPPVSAAAAVWQAVQALDVQRRGVVAFDVRDAYEERGPAHHVSTLADSIRLRKDGTLIAVRLLAETANGQPLASDRLARDQAEIDKSLPQDPYRLPLTPQAFGEYRFAYVTDQCLPCGPGVVDVSFTSRVRDADHGDGTMLLDTAHQRFTSVTFHPSVLPPKADSGTIEMRFASALPDLWDVAESHEHYTGHVLFMHGWGDVKWTYRNYRRFQSAEDGLKYVKNATAPVSNTMAP